MSEKKDRFLVAAEKNAQELFAIGCDIFDHPECGLEEFYASDLLVTYLKSKGFQVERGIAGLETAFRAVWERGTGGPAIGFLLEYDALRDMGHACGHHLQGPACIGAALALMEACDEPFKLVLYGTPDEEGQGGKIVMERSGCFRDVDVMFAHHAAASTSTSYKNRALAPLRVTFHGTPAHASGSPHKGRSAMDAMLLAFHGLEVLREHVQDGCRIHYTILEGTGPSNIVHETAKAHITLRSYDRHYLEEMMQRAENVIKGACLMTDTTADIIPRNIYWNFVPVSALRELVLDTASELGAENLVREKVVGGGSTDVSNVSWVVPTANVYTLLCNGGAHTQAYLDAGKTENGFGCMLSGSKIIGLTALKLIGNSALLEAIKEEHRLAVQPHNS